jgi:hypothetical protein
MSNDTLNEVDVNTDDLDAFNDLFNGNATEAKSEGSELENTEDDSLANEEQEETEEAYDDEDVTDSDEEEAEEDHADVEDDTPKSKKKTAQERINEITAARREAERKADMLEGRLAEMERRLNLDKVDEKPKADKTPEDGSNLPDPSATNEDGEDLYPLGEFDPAFIRDLTRATIAQEMEQEREALKQEQEEAKYKEAQAEVDKEWNSRIADAVETKENFVESVRNLEDTFSSIDPQYGNYLANTIKQSDYGTEILYYLSQNLEEAQQIAGAGPASATLALGRLEARFMSNDSEKTKPPANRVTKATSPPPKHTRGTGGAQRVAADTDDLDAFEKQFFK